jgi:hypothetical protein
MGTLGVGIMNSMAFSLLANSNPEVDESQEIELTIGSLSFYVGPLGLTRLSDLAKLGPSASKAERITMSRSSVGSSSQVNSSVSLTATENMQKGLEEFDETCGKPDMEATVVKPHDSPRDFATRSSGVSRSVHQLCVIITEAAEENNHEGNEEVDMQVDKPRSNSKKEKEKIHVSTGEWRIIMSAINHGMEVPADSRREGLMGYQYVLHQRRKKLREERDMFMRSQDNNSTSSGGYWDEYSEASESSMERHRDPKHSKRTTARTIEEIYMKSLSAHPPEEEEEFVQETPEAALVAAHAYLLTTQPKPGDPREHMLQAAIRSLGLIEDKLRGNLLEKKATHHKERRKERQNPMLLHTTLECNQKFTRRRLRRESNRCFFGWPSSFGPRGRDRENIAKDSV